MQILLAAATELEIASWEPESPWVDVLITGVGVPSALYQLTKRLHQMDYDLVVMAGIAGTFQHNWKPAEVVIVGEDCFADLGAIEKGQFHSLSQMGLSAPDSFPYQNGWLVNPLADSISWPYRIVRGITVNTITDDRNQVNIFKNAWQPQVESMEGAALHYACLQAGVPFLQIRSISNLVGIRDKSQWKLKESVEALAPAINQAIGLYLASK